MWNRPLTRRFVLKGLGVSIGLPLLEAMLPLPLSASQAAASARTFPRRLAFLYIPNGVIVPQWRVTGQGKDFTFGRTLSPLAPFKDDILVLSGLTCDKARPNGDGPGDHGRAMGAFLTATQPRKTAGLDTRTGISLDQFAAQNVGNATRFPSLELGCEYGRQEGNCDSGYACTYTNNLSWRTPTTPAPKEVNPRLVFDRLFAGQAARETSEAIAQRELFNQSILDFVREDTNQLRNRLGATDLRRMDEYLSSIREVERRLTQPPAELPREVTEAMPRPARIPELFRDHFRLMADLLALAFQGDLTRISTLVFGVEGSRRSFPEIGITDEHHGISHHQNNPTRVEQHARINQFHVEQLAYFLGKLRSIREGDGTLLDNCMICYGGGNADGNAHTHHDLPIVLAGKSGGTIETGRHVVYPRDTPIANLYLCMLDRMGVEAERFGDSTGRLAGLTA
jgi:Protein of unknown function (DUF1552)